MNTQRIREVAIPFLRNEELAQTRGRLRRGFSFCAVGAMAEAARQHTGNESWRWEPAFVGYDMDFITETHRDTCSAAPEIETFYGLTDGALKLPFDSITVTINGSEKTLCDPSVMGMNDSEHMSFASIACALEQACDMYDAQMQASASGCAGAGVQAPEGT